MRRLRIQSQLLGLQKTAVFHSHLASIHYILQSHLLCHYGLSSEFFDGARFVVHTKNPEACRLPVRPFQTSAKLFPLEDSLSGPMTLLASIPPRCKIFIPQWKDRYSTSTIPRIDFSSPTPICTYSLEILLQSSPLLNPTLINSKVRLRLWARCLCCPIPLDIRFSQTCLADDFG